MAETEHKGYETQDFSMRAVGYFFGGIAVLAILAIFAMLGLTRFMTEREGVGGASVAAQPDVTQAPPLPRLQIAPTQDLLQLRAEEDAQLRNYRWVDRQAGIASIPIDRAMDLLAQRGLKTGGPATTQSSQEPKEQR
jgi:hypothetical protein